MFLNDLDLANASSNPNAIDDGMYLGYLFEAKVIDKKDNTKSLVITYKVAQEGKDQGKTVEEWKSLVNDDRQKAFLKRRLEQLGVPESKFATLTPDDLVGTKVYFTVKNNGDYCNVTKVTLADGVAASVDALANAGTAPTAPTAENPLGF